MPHTSSSFAPPLISLLPYSHSHPLFNLIYSPPKFDLLSCLFPPLLSLPLPTPLSCPPFLYSPLFPSLNQNRERTLERATIAFQTSSKTIQAIKEASEAASILPIQVRTVSLHVMFLTSLVFSHLVLFSLTFHTAYTSSNCAWTSCHILILFYLTFSYFTFSYPQIELLSLHSHSYCLV